MREKISKNFYADEFKCKCKRPDCDAPPPTPELIDLCQKIRDQVGRPLIVNSGSRCKWYNDRLKKSSKTSRHLTGEAADLRTVTGSGRFRIIEAAIYCCARGLGVANKFIHVDVRKGSVSAWGY